MTNKKPQKTPLIFKCEKCNFICSNKKDFNRHLATRKHEIRTNTKLNTPNYPKYECVCGKSYKHQSSLWNHKKKCIHDKAEEVTEPTVEYLLKENLEMKKDNLEIKKFMIDICKKMEPGSNISNSTINSNNKIFNVNVFLNEHCKDAINISEFIKSIEVSVTDLQRIGNEGQTKGMSNIIIDKLNDMDVLKRPVHCSDLMKETIYIKDDDKWEEESKERSKLKTVIEQVTKKSIKGLPELEHDPEEFQKTINEVLKDPRDDKKIISAIANEVCLK